MKFIFPWSLLSESRVYFMSLFFSFYKVHSIESPLTNFEQILLCSFGEICGQPLTTSAYLKQG